MTYEEAIENLICDKFLILCASQHPDKCNFTEIEMAKEAIEKQIPKKPYDIVCCPSCKLEVELQPIDAEEVTYCLHCGQAIDWGTT